MICKFKNLCIHLCIKLLIIQGIPRKTFAFTKNYLYEHVDNINRNKKEFITSVDRRSRTMNKMLSLSNWDLILSAFFMFWCYFCCLFLIFSAIALFIDIKEYAIYAIFIKSLVLVSLFLGCIFKICSDVFIFRMYEQYLDILCIIEATYICLELESQSVLVEHSALIGAKRRIKNLSKLVRVYGKVNKDTHKHYRAMSIDISNKVDWLNRPINSTLQDLRSYFKQTKYHWIVGRMGEIEFDEKLLYKESKRINMSNFIDKIFELLERLVALIERIKKLLSK